MCSETPEPCRVTWPDHEPGWTVVPFNARVKVAEPFASMVMLVLSSVGVTPEPVALGTAAAASVTEPAPVLVSCTCCVTAPFVTAPKEKVAGLLTTVAFTAAPASKRPLPTDCTSTGSSKSSAVTAFELALLTNADLICAGVKSGCFCLTSAAAPATNGEARLVPALPNE